MRRFRGYPEVFIHGLVRDHETLYLVFAAVYGVRVVFHPFGGVGGKERVELLCGVIPGRKGIERSLSKLHKQLGRFFDSLKTDELLDNRAEGFGDLIAGLLAGVTHVL